MHPLLKLLALLTVAPLCATAFWALERRFPIHVRPRALRRDVLLDCSFFLASALVVAPLAPPLRTAFVAFVLGPLIPNWESGQIMTGHGFLATLPLWALLPLLMVAHDFLEYWIHRALHSRWLWRFHVVHHSPREMDWLVFCRNHPIEVLVNHVIRGGGLALLGFPFKVVAVYDALFFGLVGIVTHANLSVPAWTRKPWKYLFVSPVFHHWHHTTEREGIDKNLASVLVVWDILFGTFYLPDRPPHRYGVVHPIRESFLGLMASAFLGQRHFRAPDPEGEQVQR